MKLPLLLHSARSLLEETLDRGAVGGEFRGPKGRRERTLRLAALENRVMFSATPLDLPTEPVEEPTSEPDEITVVADTGPSLGSPTGPSAHVIVDPVTNSVVSQPHLERTGPNLFPKPEIDGSFGWYPANDVFYDAATSRTADGSGSWRFTTPANESSLYSRVTSPFFTATETGEHYLSFYIKSENGPSYFAYNLRRYSPTGSALGNSDWGTAGTTADGVWQEVVVPVYVDINVSPKLAIHFYKRENLEPGGKVWLDEVYFGFGSPEFEQPPPVKTPFNGSTTRVDELGNFEVLKDGVWEPFFPWAMHTNTSRTDWNDYSDQGWNVAIAMQFASQVQRAKDAGMMAGVRLAQYINNSSSPSYQNTDHLASVIQDIKDEGLSEDVLFYYWDAEFTENKWDEAINVLDTVKANDVDSNGDRMHPIYALQGAYNLARVHAGRGNVDISGTYLGGVVDDPVPVDGRYVVLNNIEGNNRPSPIAQINSADSHPGALRMRVYSALIAGARGIGYYSDGATGDPLIENAAWVGDMPALPQEVDALLPIIRQPHWTDWSATVSTSSDIRAGTREHDGVGYIFLVNRTSTAADLTISLEDLPYTAGNVVDQLTGQVVGSVNNGSFNLTLAGINIQSGTQVLRLDPLATPNNDPVAQPDAFTTSIDTVLAGDVSLNDQDPDGDTLTYVLGTGPQNGVVSLSTAGTFAYTPDAAFSGRDDFTYTVNDGNGGQATSSVTIEVGGIVHHTVESPLEVPTTEDEENVPAVSPTERTFLEENTAGDSTETQTSQPADALPEAETTELVVQPVEPTEETTVVEPTVDAAVGSLDQEASSPSILDSPTLLEDQTSSSSLDSNIQPESAPADDTEPTDGDKGKKVRSRTERASRPKQRTTSSEENVQNIEEVSADPTLSVSATATTTEVITTDTVSQNDELDTFDDGITTVEPTSTLEQADTVVVAATAASATQLFWHRRLVSLMVGLTQG